MLALCNARNIAAQSLESLVMPGEVVQAHADIESECANCHKAFDRSAQRTLCLDCHEEIARDILAQAGFHGKSPAASADSCASCHTDHEGRNANIVELNETTFDHGLTDFLLIGSHLDAACADCHQPAVLHRDAPGECVGCHAADDAHEASLGTDCATCHMESDWLEASFDHETTGYSLLGKHADAGCLDCHQSQVFEAPDTTCYGCHAADDVHEGRSGKQCENCHNPLDWAATSFDHARDTNFLLLGRHARLTCADCHSDEPFADELDVTCIGCHVEDDAHDGHYGGDCGSCHSSDDWLTTQFDHARDTDFRLNGAHRDVACVDCHIEPVFSASPGLDCLSCHLDDDVHAGTQGESCQDCHTETGWAEVPLFDHDLTPFPLLGEHDNLDCASCHETQVFSDAQADCNSCHLDDDVHAGDFGIECQTCHNPVAWDLWLFDHNARTDFQLTGAHVAVACNDCHSGPLTSMAIQGERCASCHRSDDVHDGEFGTDCARCHNDVSFKDVRSLR